MADQFLAEIRIFGCNFAPVGWALCNGQILPISQYTALYSLLGNTYGGNGTSTFGLPNLQGNTPMEAGAGPGLSVRDLGEVGGSPTVTLLPAEMPLHNHSFSVDPATKKESSSVANTSPSASDPGTTFYSASAPNTTMAPGMLSLNGGGQPHDNMQPYLTLNFCIALQGIYPARP